MNKLLVKKLLCAALFGFLTSQALAIGNVEDGKTKSAPCAACHNADGNSINSEWPSLAGQHQTYLVEQLKAFKKGKAPGGRYNALMESQVANLTDQDIEDLAAYFASQTTKIGAVPKEQLALGQRLYRGGDLKKGISACIACHGPQGLGNAEAHFPRVSGQQTQYVVNQLKAYKSGERNTSSHSVIMQNIAVRMDDNDMLAIGAYVSGLH